ALTRVADYRTNIILSAATRAAAGAAAAASRPLGTVTVKGRSEPVEIFAVDAGEPAGTNPPTQSETPFLSS
ncbi:MAG: hypothetical protein ACKOTE_18775, partial [Opitutaceae bacterium]